MLFVLLLVNFTHFLFADSKTVINNTYNKRQDLLAERVVRGQILGNKGEVLAQTIEDDDGNSKFSSDEDVATGSGTSLSYTPVSTFYGPLYWKLEVKDKAGMTTSVTGLSYIKKPENTPAQTVRVLQIMPARAKCEYNSEGERANSLTSLYFCTVCQQSYGRLEYNPDTKSGDRYHYGTMYQGMYRAWNNGYALFNSRVLE